MTLPAQKAEQRVLVLRQPVGVTAAITPWNFPAAMMTRKLGPALAAGCTMIVKPASATPLTAIEIVQLMHEAGVPAGVVNVITSRRTADVSATLFGDRARAQDLVHRLDRGRQGADPRLRRAGQAPVARARRPRARRRSSRTPTSSSPSTRRSRRKYRNAGQTCVCANRIYVQRGIHEQFVELMAEKVKAIKVGPGRARRRRPSAR